MRKDLCNAFGAMNVRACMERNKSTASILEKYNKSLEHAMNIKTKLANYQIRLAEMQSLGCPLHQVEPLVELTVELCETASKAFKDSDDFKALADALSKEARCNDLEDELERHHIEEEHLEHLDAIQAGEDNVTHHEF